MAIVVLAAWGAVVAQESTSFRIKSAVMNAGGHPLNGVDSASSSFVLRPDALGQAMVTRSSASGSFRISSGFVLAFPAPGEVENLVFINDTTLAWDAEPLATHYHVYRAGPMGALAGLAPVSSCLQPDVTMTMTADGDVPPAGQGYFYLVNAANGIGLEGPTTTGGTECP